MIVNKTSYQLNNFLILSRISSSKNLEIAIDGFLNSNFGNCNLDIIGGTLNSRDEEYFGKLKNNYSQPNVNFLGKIGHSKLPTLINNYDICFNSAGDGFFDKSILETLSCGILNFYHNRDFDDIYGPYAERFYFDNETDLTNKINTLSLMTSKDTETFFHEIEEKLNSHSLDTLANRLKPFF